MSWIDWTIIFVLAVSTITALLRGLVLEIFSLAGLILGIFIAGWQYDNFAPLLMHFGLSKNVSDAIAFLLIAFGVAIAVSLLGKLIRKVVHGVGLGWVDRVLGAMFGLLRGAAVVVIAVVAIAAFFPRSFWMQDSRLVPFFLQASSPVEQWFPATLRDKISVGRLRHDPANLPTQ